MKIKNWLSFSKPKQALPKVEEKPIKNVLIDKDPYSESQFKQFKYGVYLISDDNDIYKLGDLRRMGHYGMPRSYLELDKVCQHGAKYTPKDLDELRELNTTERHLITKELDKTFLTSDLMAEDSSFRKNIESQLGFKIIE